MSRFRCAVGDIKKAFYSLWPLCVGIPVLIYILGLKWFLIIGFVSFAGTVSLILFASMIEKIRSAPENLKRKK